MEQNSLFPFKYRLRKTGEPVEIVAWETAEKGARSENDWVSYIDASGAEHIKEHLTLEWDFVIQTPFEKGLFDGLTSGLPKFDAWEARRYEMVKEQVIQNGTPVDAAIYLADSIIAKLNPEGKSAPGQVVYEPNKGL